MTHKFEWILVSYWAYATGPESLTRWRWVWQAVQELADDAYNTDARAEYDDLLTLLGVAADHAQLTPDDLAAELQRLLDIAEIVDNDPDM